MWAGNIIFRALGRIAQLVPIGADQAVRSVLRLAITLSVARFCSREDFAFYTTMQPVYMFMLLFCTSFILGPYVVFVHDRRDRGTGVYNASILLLFFLSLALLGALYVILFAWIYTPAHHSLVFLLASLWFVAGDLCNVFSRNLCLATLNYRKPLLAGLCSAVIFGAGFAVMGSSATLVRLLVLAGSGYMIPCFAVWASIEKGRPSFSGDVRESITRHFHFGKWVFLNNLLNTMVFASFPFFLRIFDRVDQISTYGAYYNFFAIFNPAILVLVLFLSPRLVKSYNSGRRVFVERIRSVFKYTLVLSALFPCFVLLAGKPVFSLFYGREYAAALVVLLVWGIAKMIEINACVLNAALKATRQTSRIFVASAITAVVFLAAGLPLVKRFGLWGIAVCLILTQITWAVSLFGFLSFVKKTEGSGDHDDA